MIHCLKIAFFLLMFLGKLLCFLTEKDIMGFPFPHNKLIYVSLKISQNKEPSYESGRASF